MGPRSRKAIASLGVLIFLAVYIWGVIALGAFVPGAWWAQVLYFAVAGLAWGVPVLPLIAWAEKGGK